MFNTIKISNWLLAYNSSLAYKLILWDAIVAGLCTPDKPGSPRILSVTSQSVKLEWTAPESDDGSRILGYVVIYGSSAAPRALYSTEYFKGPTTNCTVTDNLWPGRAYYFAVAAKNRAGCGEFSNSSSSITIPAEPGNVVETSFLWQPYVIGRPYIFSSCGFFFFFLFLA